MFNKNILPFRSCAFTVVQGTLVLQTQTWWWAQAQVRSWLHRRCQLVCAGPCDSKKGKTGKWSPVVRNKWNVIARIRGSPCCSGCIQDAAIVLEYYRTRGRWNSFFDLGNCQVVNLCFFSVYERNMSCLLIWFICLLIYISSICKDAF